MNFIVKSIDLFKSHFSFRINKEEKTSTFLGFLLSLAILSFLSVYFFSSDIFYKLKPITTDQELQLDFPETLNLNQDNFGFAAGISDLSGQTYINPLIFTLSMSKKSFNKSNYIHEEKNYHKCNESDFQNNLQFTNPAIRNSFCLDDPKLQLEGSFGIDYVSFFAVRVFLCNNQTMNGKCKTEEEINEFFSDKILTIFFMQASYDLNNYNNPLKQNYKSYYWALSSNLRKFITLSFKKVEIITDDGIVFQDKSKLESFHLNEITADMDLNYKESIITLNFFTSDKKQFAERNYQKIQEVLANLGGIFSFFMTIGFVITKMQVETNLINGIMNNLYSFQVKENNNSQSNEKINTNLKKIEEIKNDIIIKENINNSIENIQLFSEDSNRFSPNKNIRKEGTTFNNEKPKIPSNPLINFQSNDIIMEKSSPQALNNSSDKLENKSKSIECIDVKSGISIRTISKKSNFNNKNNLKRDKKLKNFDNLMNNKEKFTFRLYEYIKFKLKILFKVTLNHKEKLFSKTQEIFYEEIDLSSILKRIQEIDKLKMLLLNERQLFMFNYLTKPLIYVENQNALIKDHSSSLRRSTIEKNYSKEGLVKYYNETINNKNNSEIDKKIEFLDQKVREIQ